MAAGQAGGGHAEAVFPAAAAPAGMYESYYLRCVSPREPLGLWIRYTVHKRPGQRPKGSLWFTLFDAAAGAPLQRKRTSDELSVPAGGWISVAGSAFGPEAAEGCVEEVSWSLRVQARESELRHLSPEWLYRAPVPRTKLTSPAPLATFSGRVSVPGRDPLLLEGWPGMVGHNWGSEHAERWIWLNGLDFAGERDAWIDLAIGRVRVGGRLTPWAASGALSLGGRRHRLGGLLARGTHVQESAGGAVFEVRGARGVAVRGRMTAPEGQRAGWRYADPDGGEHDVVNCSTAGLELSVKLPVRAGGSDAQVDIGTDHGGVFELGMRERDHGVPIAPYPDG